MNSCNALLWTNGILNIIILSASRLLNVIRFLCLQIGWIQSRNILYFALTGAMRKKISRSESFAGARISCRPLIDWLGAFSSRGLATMVLQSSISSVFRMTSPKLFDFDHISCHQSSLFSSLEGSSLPLVPRILPFRATAIGILSYLRVPSTPHVPLHHS